MSAYRPFKATERAVAAALNGKRIGHLGGFNRAYPCKPDIFEATYEPVEDDTP